MAAPPRPRRLARRPALAAALGCAAAVAAGCGGGDDPREAEAEAEAAPIRVMSPDTRGGRLPRRFTCDGEGAAPSLTWSGLPEDTASIAVVVDDPDARGGPYVHRTVWGLQPEVRSLVGEEGPSEGASSAGRPGWTPPCPPRGDPAHRYRFTVHALREPLDLRPGAAPDAVTRSIAARRLASGTLVVRYGR